MTFGPSLIPAEFWEYGLGDLVRGVKDALSERSSIPPLALPELGECIPIRSARAGLVVALQALDLLPGARIGVPLYCCPVVFKAIVAAGCVPRFVDVDPATFCISIDDFAKKQADIDCLMAVHMFGNVCDVSKLRGLMGKKPVIEDCAQSLGSKIAGQPTGTLGDVSVFSFRSGKYLSVGEGGALFSASPARRVRLQQLTARLMGAGRVEECGHVFRSYARSKLRSRPLYGLVGYPLWQAYNRSVSYSTKSPLVMGRMYRSDGALAVRRLATFRSAIETRRAQSELYARLLDGTSLTLSAEPPHVYYNRYQYPMLFPSAAWRDTVAADLHRCGIDTSKPYSDIAGIARMHYGYAGDCPASEHIAERVLVVPNHEALTPSDVQHITRSIEKALHKLEVAGFNKGSDSVGAGSGTLRRSGIRSRSI